MVLFWLQWLRPTPAEMALFPTGPNNPVQNQRSAASFCEESPQCGTWLYDRANPASATHCHGSCASDRLASECGKHFAPGGRGWPLATFPTWHRQTAGLIGSFPPKSCEGRNVLLPECSLSLGGKAPSAGRGLCRTPRWTTPGPPRRVPFFSVAPANLKLAKAPSLPIVRFAVAVI